MADVFDAHIYRFESTQSAALGAALRAWQADAHLLWPEVVSDFCKPIGEDAVSPREQNVTTYRSLQRRYTALEQSALAGGKLGASS
jgi:sugar (pentulose or hexulose) kinase